MAPQPRRDFLRQVAGAAVAWPAVTALAKESSPTKPRIKIGQIGVKHAHASKLAVYRQSPDYEVVGLVEPDAAARDAAQQQPAFRDLKWMTREELLNQPGLQAVLVETEVRDLLDTAETCLAAGKHIHLDKPAGESLPHFRRILDAARRQKLVVQMGYMFRYNPGVVLLQELLDRGWLGEIFEVDAVMSKVVNPNSRRELAEYPGGIMFELGGHVMDLVIGVLGQPERVTGYNRRTSAAKDDGLLDNMLAVLEYPVAVATVRSAAVEVEGFARRQLTVCGTEGTLHIQPLDNPSAKLALSKPRGEYRAGYQDIALPKYVRYVDDAADMARAIRGEAEFRYSYDQDLAVQTALLTASGMPLE
jgi:predicted dehydrogenase